MKAAARTSGHAALMDGIYHRQRHIYDLTRKYYLLGRDRMLAGLDVPPGGSVLELGCGTGRNIMLAARRYPNASFFGLDISSEMLETASKATIRSGLADQVKLADGDATKFEAGLLFGQNLGQVHVHYTSVTELLARKETAFDRVFISIQ